MFDKTEKVVISIQGMHCNHCKAKVENTIKSIKGVKKFTVSLEEANATVDYVAKKTNPREIAAAITAAGFNANI